MLFVFFVIAIVPALNLVGIAIAIKISKRKENLFYFAAFGEKFFVQIMKNFGIGLINSTSPQL